MDQHLIQADGIFLCLYVEVDEPFGGLGDCEYILNTLISKKPLMWKNKVVYDENDIIKLQINPLSVLVYVQNMEFSKRIHGKEVETVFGFPNYNIDEIKEHTNIVSKWKRQHKFISFEQKKVIPFGRKKIKG